MNMFSHQKSEMSNFLCFSKKKVIFNKSKNASVRFFINMSSMCVQLFTAFEEAVLKLYIHLYLGECPKIEYGCHFHGNQPREKNVCFIHIFSY